MDIKPPKRSKLEDFEDDLEPSNEEIDNFTSQSKPGIAPVSQINQDYSLNSSKDSGDCFEDVQPVPAATQDVEKQTEDTIDLTDAEGSESFEDVQPLQPAFSTSQNDLTDPNTPDQNKIDEESESDGFEDVHPLA